MENMDPRIIKLKKSAVFIYVIALSILSSCSGNSYSPKPRGFYRILFPTKSYLKYSGTCPFTFDYPAYSTVVRDSSSDTEPCWLNIEFPQFQGKIHISYKEIGSIKMFHQLTEDARDFAYKHTVKATDIEEIPISDASNHVYGVYYDIEGNTASSAQFYLTDSNRHYFRAALYFSVEPRIDSIRPVLNFVKVDIDRMIKSFRWKN